MKNYVDDVLLDYLMEGFQLISFEWCYLYVNKSVVLQSKYAKEDLLGYTMMEKYPGIEHSDMFKVLQRCMKERKSEQIENEFFYPDNTKGWFQLHIQPVPEGIFILSTDITNRKKAELELVEFNEHLEKIVALRTSELEDKNKNIIDSLHYAKNIQNAFLSDKSDFSNLFQDSMIIYKPKDIVSGDFYWYKELGDEIFIAAADCTGHGVPGALMSMIGIEKLNNVVLKSKNPADILKQLNNDIKLALSDVTGQKKCNDGMDIAICSVNKKDRTLNFSGANRPLWIIRKDKKEIEEIKPSKKSIGGFTEFNQDFENHIVKLQQGDTFYIFSDGYADSFGGQAGKKLMTKKFKEILLGIQMKTMSDQEFFLGTFIEEWKEGLEQVDDILVIGVRV